MFACTYTMGRWSARASAGVETSGRESTSSGSSRPSVVRPSSCRLIGTPAPCSESTNAITSAYVDVSA